MKKGAIKTTGEVVSELNLNALSRETGQCHGPVVQKMIFLSGFPINY